MQEQVFTEYTAKSCWLPDDYFWAADRKVVKFDGTSEGLINESSACVISF